MSYSVLIRNAIASKEILEVVKNSRLFRNLKIGEIIRDGKNVSEVKVNSDVDTISQTSINATNNTRSLSSTSSSEITIPASSGGNLAKSLVDQISVSKSIATSIKSLVAQLEITNEILASQLSNNSDLLSSINTCLYSIGSEIKAFRDFAVEAEYIKTPLSILQLEKTQFEVDGTTSDGSKLVNSFGENIIPMHEKAKKDSEKLIDQKDKNLMDYAGLEDLLDLQTDENGFDINLLSKVLENVLTFDVNKDVAGDSLGGVQ